MKFQPLQISTIALAALLTSGGTLLHAEEPAAPESDSDLAMQLVNPVASLISLPLQNNFDWGAGVDGDGFQYRINVQPVIPFALNEDWNLISRTILPYVYQEDVFGSTTQSGLSDTLQSFFFSPQTPGESGIIWGAGPALLLPTATDELLGTEKWGAGPTAVALRQSNGWTVGMLANHLWSYAGEDQRQWSGMGTALHTNPTLAPLLESPSTINPNHSPLREPQYQTNPNENRTIHPHRVAACDRQHPRRHRSGNQLHCRA